MNTPPGITETIYLLEIDADVLAMMQNILEDLGYRVITGVGEPISLPLITVRPDLIFVDYRLINGDTQYRHDLKSNLGNLQVPIILTTTENPPWKFLAPLQVNDVLSKPFDLDEFVAKVFYWLTSDR